MDKAEAKETIIELARAFELKDLQEVNKELARMVYDRKRVNDEIEGLKERLTWYFNTGLTLTIPPIDYSEFSFGERTITSLDEFMNEIIINKKEDPEEFLAPL